MGLISHNIASLNGGVSQQPAAIRHSSQAEAQVNALSHVARGLQKRPPFQHVAKVTSSPVSNAYIHIINRDQVERYEVVITDGDLKVFDLAGTEKTVAFPDGKTYLDVSSARQDFDVVTIADYTFIVNRTVTVAMVATTAGGTNKGSKQLFADLPTTGMVDGDVWQITGDPTSVTGSFYVKYVSASAVWQECPLPGVQTSFNAATMPHILVREADGTFTFKKATWDDRLVGDTTSAPAPSFVGKKIKSVFFHRDRVAVTADEAVVLGASGDYFNFWRESAATVNDADPIDVTASHIKVSIIYSVVPFNKALLLFTDQTQFLLHSNDEALTSRTVVIDPATEYDASTLSRPVGAGANVYFGVPRGTSTGVYEYYVDTSNVQHYATDVTAHVPSYVPASVFKFASSNSADILLALAPSYPSRIYVYTYFWRGNDKVHLSWSYWELASSDTVLDVAFVEDTLYAVISRSDGVFLEKAQLSGDEAETSMGFIVYLDRRKRYTGVYDDVANTTTWTIPYVDSGSDLQVVLSEGFTGRKGEVLGSVTRPSTTTLQSTGNLSGGEVYIGRKYEMRYEFSTAYLREERGGSQVAVTDGRLQLRTFSVTYAGTGYFKALVSVADRDDAEYVFNGHLLGSFALGVPPIQDGTFRFAVGARNLYTTITLINDSPYPSNFLSADWEAFYSARARRV